MKTYTNTIDTMQEGLVFAQCFKLIMSCETPKEAWDKIKEDYEGNHQETHAILN